MTVFPEMGRTPRRALVVEDSMIIAMEAEDCLLELGVAEVEVAGTVEGALAAMDRSTFDVAILDYDLGDQTSETVANRLVENGTPFAIASGYADLDRHFELLGAAAVLGKPYSKADLRRMLDVVTGRKAA